MEVMLTPRFFDKPTAWSSTKADPSQYCSLAFTAGTLYSGTPWNGGSHYFTTAASDQLAKNILNPEAKEEPPTTIYALYEDWNDDVSLLHDDPDDDDDELLPSSTYDVLVPLLDEMYKDESEA
jgi:hypothetical protein